MHFLIEQLSYQEIPSYWPVTGGSALEMHQGKIALIADDHTRFYYSENEGTTWSSLSLVPDAPASLEKPLKYDWEAMTLLPVGHARFICLLGSGSKSPQRDIAALVSLRSFQTISLVNVQQWYHSLRALSGLGSEHFNIEAAVVADQSLFLFNRGLKDQHHLAFQCSLKDCAQYFLENTSNIPSATLHPFKTPLIENYSSGLAAMSPLSENRQLYLASCTAEDTTNSYDDGPIIGSAIALYQYHQGHWNLMHAIPLCDASGNPLSLKVEGITKAEKLDKNLYKCYFITDQDTGRGHWGSFLLRLHP